MAAAAVLHVGSRRILSLLLAGALLLLVVVAPIRGPVVRIAVPDFAKQRRPEECEEERRQRQDTPAGGGCGVSASVVVVDGPAVSLQHGRNEAVHGEGQAEGGGVSQGLVGANDDALAVGRSAEGLGEHGGHDAGDRVGDPGRHLCRFPPPVCFYLPAQYNTHVHAVFNWYPYASRSSDRGRPDDGQ